MADNGKTARSGGRESLRKVSISRIKKEMSDVFYLSDDLVISALTADKNTTADYPTSIDGFTAIIMMTGEATVSIDMQNYSIKPNTIVFFNPDSIIRTIKCSSNAAAYLLAFSKSFVNEIQIDLSTSLPVYMRFGQSPRAGGRAAGRGRNPPVVPAHQDHAAQRQGALPPRDHPHALHHGVLHHHRDQPARAARRDEAGALRGAVRRVHVAAATVQQAGTQRELLRQAAEYHAQIPLVRGEGGERQDRRAVDRRVGDPRSQGPARSIPE